MLKSSIYTIIICILPLFTFSQSSDIEAVKIYSQDITNFYKAFDLALEDTSNAQSIFEQNYFDVGTKGLKDFKKTKIQSSERFTRFVLRNQQFYKDIRPNIIQTEDLKERVLANFKTFQSLYPEAVFPDIYLLVGRFSSNGTISKRGLLIGTEILGKSDNIDTKKWNKNITRLSMKREHIPVTISHELIHFNQKKMAKEKTLLKYALIEGSAEFIAELISGETDGSYTAFKGREKAIWDDFKIDKSKDIFSEWHQPNEPKRPRNALYWAGYLICKSYYQQTNNKVETINKILTLKNYGQFYEDSKVEEFIENNY